MIKRKDDLIDYIFRQLGAPTVEVELTDEQVQDCIDYTIKEFSTFAYDGELEETVILQVNGKGYYQMPDFVTSIIAVKSIQGFQNYGSNYIPDRWSEEYFRAFESNSTGVDAIISVSNNFTLFEKYMMREMNYTFNEYNNKLHVLGNTTGNILIHYNMEYTPDKVDKIYNQQWVKDMSVARARLQQSTVVGKYTQSLVGGATINFDMMRSLAQDEIADLKEQLFSKYAGPAPILVL